MNTFTKVVINIALGCLTCLVVVWFLISPQLKNINVVNSDVKQKKIELATLDQQIRAYKNAQADLAKATRKADISGAIVTKEQLVVPVQDLETAATKSATVELLQIEELANPALAAKKDKQTAILTKPVAGITEVDYHISTVSDYVGMVKFLAYLEHLPHFTELGEIALSSKLDLTALSDPTQINSGQIDGNFKGAFFIKTPAK